MKENRRRVEGNRNERKGIETNGKELKRTTQRKIDHNPTEFMKTKLLNTLPTTFQLDDCRGSSQNTVRLELSNDCHNNPALLSLSCFFPLFFVLLSKSNFDTQFARLPNTEDWGIRSYVTTTISLIGTDHPHN